MRVRLLYFASLRDAAGLDEEGLEIASMSLARIYDEARDRHGFTFPRERLRVARNGAFAEWDGIATEGDEIAFIPPVSGG
ncbi:MAG TPA: MoaD/ThiS family protein [Xanthomonadaceae bacterium]|jgi:molybdopterin synthase sulfur carrier subunit|nr:MoaD/ThiS family protein [Xanthomonadaceae bacterium]